MPRPVVDKEELQENWDNWLTDFVARHINKPTTDPQAVAVRPKPVQEKDITGYTSNSPASVDDL